MGESDLRIDDVIDELKCCEAMFRWPALGTTRAELEKMLAEDFWETGASGRRWRRAEGLDVLEERSKNSNGEVWETSGFGCQRLAADVFLLTYTLVQDGARRTRRASIWRRTEEGWEIVYHQGTVVQD